MKQIFLFMILTVVLSCKEENKMSRLRALNTYNIDNISEQSMGNLLDQAMNINVIPLETNENSIISEITDVKTAKNKIYIFDQEQKVIFLFNENGEFVNKIDRRGRSLPEYLNLKSFDVNESGEIVILDNLSSKLLIFSSEGDFIKHIRLKFDNINYDEVSFAFDSTFCLIAKPQKERSGTDCMIHIVDNKGELIESELSFPEAYSKIAAKQYFNIATYRDEESNICIKFPFDNRVFTKTKDSVYCNTEIKFIECDDTDKMFNHADNISGSADIYFIDHTDIALTGREFFDKKDYILSNVFYKDRYPKYLFYNKKTGESILYNFKDMSSLYRIMANIPRTRIYNGNANKLITEVRPSTASYFIQKGVPEDAPENIKTTVAKFQKFDINPQDNPILVFFELSI